MENNCQCYICIMRVQNATVYNTEMPEVRKMI
jgi:hypothetical protein